MTRPLVSRKRAKEKKGNFKKNGKQVATPMKKPKARPKPEMECFYYKKERKEAKKKKAQIKNERKREKGQCYYPLPHLC